MTTVKKQRSANLDLLRIVSMLLIVFLHSIDHSGVLENAENCGTGMYFYIRFAYGLCQVCVNIYIMLSGYFMIHSAFRLQKLAALWMEAAFYSVVLKLLFMVTGQEDFSILSLIGCFFPILTGRYWFLTIYVGMYLLSPFLNILIRSLDRKQHSLLNLCLFGLFSVWVSIHPAIAGMKSGGGWGLAWFVVLYIAAAWFRLYYTPDGKPARWLLAYVAISVLMAAAQVAARAWNVGIMQKILANWFRYDSAPVYLMTLALFAGFLNINIRSAGAARLICTAAPLTLGVYLIHAHANVSPWSWAVLDLPGRMDSALFLPIQLGAVLLIFGVCAGVDLLRSRTLGRLENSPPVHALCSRVTAAAQKLLKL